MSISKYNAEGYYDPTAYKALTKIENNPFQDFNKIKIYVCSPYKGEIAKNTANARKYCRFVVKRGGLPIAVHLLFPQFMDDENPTERKRALEMGLELIKICDELWVFGSFFSAGMETEIDIAKELKIKVRFFDDKYTEVLQDAKQ